MTKIRILNIISFARFQAVLFALLGLVAGILYSVGGFFIDVLVTLNIVYTPETPGLSYGTLLAFGALMVMPFMCAVVGFALRLVEALLYNVLVRWFGGLELRVQKYK
jgi:hypothetical protein